MHLAAFDFGNIKDVIDQESWNWEARASFIYAFVEAFRIAGVFLAIAVRPMMALMGVRISWDMRDKKTLLA